MVCNWCLIHEMGINLFCAYSRLLLYIINSWLVTILLPLSVFLCRSFSTTQPYIRNHQLNGTRCMKKRGREAVSATVGMILIYEASVWKYKKYLLFFNKRKLLLWEHFNESAAKVCKVTLLQWRDTGELNCLLLIPLHHLLIRRKIGNYRSPPEISFRAIKSNIFLQ